MYFLPPSFHSKKRKTSWGRWGGWRCTQKLSYFLNIFFRFKVVAVVKSLLNSKSEIFKRLHDTDLCQALHVHLI